jgi:Flp pilus assembly protein protease CpaA
MNDAPVEEGLPPSLRFLKSLVILLMLTMIVGVITIVGLLVTRMQHGFTASPSLPQAIELPEGSTPRAVTMGTGWIAVVTSDDRILIFEPNGTLRQEVTLLPAP